MPKPPPYPGTLPPSAYHTLSRRSWLGWLGKAGGVALASVAGCDLGERERSDGGADGLDLRERPELVHGELSAGEVRLDGAEDADVDADANGGFGFAPGAREGELFDRWPQRTVDPQDADEIGRAHV